MLMTIYTASEKNSLQTTYDNNRNVKRRAC